jgi:hypothetical protein
MTSPETFPPEKSENFLSATFFFPSSLVLGLVDTGSPVTLLDKSLESKLGTRLGTTTVLSFYGKQAAGVYVAPQFFLGSVPLMTGSNLIGMEMESLQCSAMPRSLAIFSKKPIMSVLK